LEGAIPETGGKLAPPPGPPPPTVTAGTAGFKSSVRVFRFDIVFVDIDVEVKTYSVSERKSFKNVVKYYEFILLIVPNIF
jgi:hypothetical protein